MVKSTALAYESYGPSPADQLSILHYDISTPLKDSEVLVKLLAHPINPSDIRQIQGVYPVKSPFLTNEYQSKTPKAIGGMEGLLEVVEIGPNVSNLHKNDWVVALDPPFPTWSTFIKAKESQLVKINKLGDKLTRTAAAGILVNVVTAYELLTTIADLKENDWIIQNASNSAVGRYVIQFAKAMNIHTINVLRDRPSIKELKEELVELGADLVLTEEENAHPNSLDKILKIVDNNPIKLAINAVGGQSAYNLTTKLSNGGIIVTFGRMTNDPVPLPAPSLIFKNLTATGYWLGQTSREKWIEGINYGVHLFNEGKLVENKSHKIVVDWENESDEEILKKYKEAINSPDKEMIVSQW